MIGKETASSLEQKRRDWILRKRQNPLTSIFAWMRHVLNNGIGTNLADLSVWQAFSIVLGVLSFLIPVTSVIWMRLLLGDEIPAKIIWLVFAILSIAQLIPFVRTRLRQAKSLDGYRADIAEKKIHLCQALKFKGNMSNDRRQSMISQVLEIMKAELLLIKGRYSKKDYTLNVLVYEDSDADEMTVKYSTRGVINCPPKKSTDLIAHYIAETDQVFAVWNLPGIPSGLFPYTTKKLSSSGPPRYKSIWFIPMTFMHPNDKGKKVVKAVLTIDSERSYEFWGRNNNELYTLRPMIMLLKQLLDARKQYIEVKEY